MSMILYLRRATEADVVRLKKNADSTPVEPQQIEKKGFLARLFSKADVAPTPQPSADYVHDFFFVDTDPGDVIDFDRAWDALNMMMTGEAFGLEGPFAIFYYQGEEIGPDAGYGPARYIPYEKMSEFQSALENLSDDELSSKFDPAAFEAAQIYSSYLYSEDGIEVDYIMQSIPDLRAFAKRCVDTGSGALVAIY